jgi:hypothetical protein
MKSEPDVFSIDMLEARPNKTEPWDGGCGCQGRSPARRPCHGRCGGLPLFEQPGRRNRAALSALDEELCRSPAALRPRHPLPACRRPQCCGAQQHAGGQLSAHWCPHWCPQFGNAAPGPNRNANLSLTLSRCRWQRAALSRPPSGTKAGANTCQAGPSVAPQLPARPFTHAPRWQGMKLGDRCFFYHSNCKVPGIVGIVKVRTA